jgi:hypothetical protein
MNKSAETHTGQTLTTVVRGMSGVVNAKVHAWQDDLKGLKKMLEDGEAAKLALEQEL